MALLPCVLPLLLTHQPFLVDDSPSPPPPPPLTEQLPANQHTFIITLYYSYRPLVAFFPFVVTSLNVVRFPKAHAQLFVVSCIIVFFPLSPSFTCRSLAIQRTIHHTPYTPRYHHIRSTLIPLVPLSSRHHRSSSCIFCRLSIHPSPSLLHTPNIPLHNHIYTLSLSLTFTSSSFLQLYYPLLRAWAVVFRSFIATVLTCQLVHWLHPKYLHNPGHRISYVHS